MAYAKDPQQSSLRRPVPTSCPTVSAMLKSHVDGSSRHLRHSQTHRHPSSPRTYSATIRRRLGDLSTDASSRVYPRCREGGTQRPRRHDDLGNPGTIACALNTACRKERVRFSCCAQSKIIMYCPPSRSAMAGIPFRMRLSVKEFFLDLLLLRWRCRWLSL